MRACHYTTFWKIALKPAWLRGQLRQNGRFWAQTVELGGAGYDEGADRAPDDGSRLAAYLRFSCVQEGAFRIDLLARFC